MVYTEIRLIIFFTIKDGEALYSQQKQDQEMTVAQIMNSKFCQENTLVIANTLFQQHTRRLYTRTSPDGQHQNQIDYILCSRRWRSSIWSAKTRPGADCGSDHELLIAKFRLKFKKVRKITRPFRYDLNQISYDYTVEVRNDREQDHPHGKEMKKGKMVVWGGLTNSCEKKRSEKQRRKEKIFPFECWVPKISKER